MLNNQKIAWMLCPSSPLPQTEILRSSKTHRPASFRRMSAFPARRTISPIGSQPKFRSWKRASSPSHGIAASTPTGTARRPRPLAAILGRHALRPTNAMAWRPASTARRTRCSSPRRATTSIRSTTATTPASAFASTAASPTAARGTFTGGWWWLGTDNGYTSSQGATTWTPAYNITTLRAYTTARRRPTRSIGFNGKNANYPRRAQRPRRSTVVAGHRPDAAEQSADLGPSQRGAGRVHGRPHAADHQEHAGAHRQAAGHPRRRPADRRLLIDLSSVRAIPNGRPGDFSPGRFFAVAQSLSE